jgi:nicotinamidase-related amidase
MARAFTEDEVVALAQRAYRHGMAGIQLVADRTVLLVIDMQDEFVRPGWTPYWVPQATQQVSLLARLVTACRARGVPVVYTVFSATHRNLDRPRSGPAMPSRYPDLGTADPAWFRDGRIWHELAPEPGEVVIHKPSYGAFYDTPLETILRNLGRDTVVITGTLTNLCCGTTARQAYERGFGVVVGSDVTATNDPAVHEHELMTLRYGFARVLTADEILEALVVGDGRAPGSARPPRL